MTKRTIKLFFLTTIRVLLIAILLAEIALRVWWGVQSANGGGAANQAWHRKYVKINKLGYRGYIPPFEKPDGTFRIVALGDSLTFGNGIEKEQDRFPDLMAKMISGRLGIKVEAVNLGLQACNTIEERKAFQDIGIKFQPDAVVIGYTNNDPESYMQRLDITGRSRGSGFVQMLTMELYLADFIYRLYSQSGNINRHREYLHYINSQNASNMPEFKQALKGIRDDCASANVGLAFVLFPTLYGLDAPSYEFQYANDMITSELDSLGIPYFDLLPLLLGRNAQELWVSRYDSHPDEMVHEMAAKGLLELVEPMISKKMKRVNP